MPLSSGSFRKDDSLRGVRGPVAFIAHVNHNNPRLRLLGSMLLSDSHTSGAAFVFQFCSPRVRGMVTRIVARTSVVERCFTSDVRS
jgi:hypothetical protein